MNPSQAIILCVRTGEPSKYKYKCGKTPYYLFLDGYDRDEFDDIEKGDLILLRSDDPKEYLLNQLPGDYNRFGCIKKSFPVHDFLLRTTTLREFEGQCYPFRFCFDLPFLTDNSLLINGNRYQIKVNFQNKTWLTNKFSLDGIYPSRQIGISDSSQLSKRPRTSSTNLPSISNLITLPSSSSSSSSLPLSSRIPKRPNNRLEYIEDFLNRTFPTLFHPLPQEDSLDERLEHVEVFLERFGFVAISDDE